MHKGNKDRRFGRAYDGILQCGGKDIVSPARDRVCE